MAKNNEKIPKIVKITIDSLQQNKEVWHFKVEMGKNSDKKTEETICPNDIFGSAIKNYITLINVLRLLNKTTEPIRKHVENSIIKMKELEANPSPESEDNKPLSRNQKRRKRKKQKSLGQSKNQIDFLSKATTTMKENLSSNGMLEKTALALALTETVTYEQIKHTIKTKGKYEINLPITEYPDLNVMRTQHSSQALSIIESVFSIGSSVAKTATGG